MGTKRSRSRFALASIIAVGALTAVSAVPADAAASDNKTYTVDIDGADADVAPAVWAGDQDATITATITNTGPSQSLGSVNLTVPAPFSLVSAPADAVPGGPIVELRNLALAPGASVTVIMRVDVRSCYAASGTFTITAKQSNDYNGTGNDFFLAPTADRVVATSTQTCQLRFAAPPRDAERTATITSVAYQPTAAAVSVEVLDATGTARIGGSTPLTAPIVLGLDANPGATSLGGVSSSPPNGGIPPLPASVATFAPTLGVSAFGYSLTATSTGLVAAPTSASFNIVDDQVNCPANTTCTSSPPPKNGQSVTVSFGAGDTNTNLLVSLDAKDAPNFTCPDYPRPSGSVVSQFVFTGDGGDDRVGTFTVSIPESSRPLNSFEVCWAAPYQFQTDAGTQATIQAGVVKPVTGEPLYVGTLPDCPKKGTLLPCVASRTFKKATSTTPALVVLSVTTKGLDPWRY
ncbi:MAG: hypothetical protein ABI658_07155 [Acidimicrobiales bacterium]